MKIINFILVLINCIITFVLANIRWVNQMPAVDEKKYKWLEDVYNLFLGQGLPTVIIPVITLIILFIINNIFLKKEIKVKRYICLFFIMFIVDVIIYRIGINIAV